MKEAVNVLVGFYLFFWPGFKVPKKKGIYELLAIKSYGPYVLHTEENKDKTLNPKIWSRIQKRFGNPDLDDSEDESPTKKNRWLPKMPFRSGNGEADEE